MIPFLRPCGCSQKQSPAHEQAVFLGSTLQCTAYEHDQGQETISEDMANEFPPNGIALSHSPRLVYKSSRISQSQSDAESHSHRPLSRFCLSPRVRIHNRVNTSYNTLYVLLVEAMLCLMLLLDIFANTIIRDAVSNYDGVKGRTMWCPFPTTTTWPSSPTTWLLRF